MGVQTGAGKADGPGHKARARSTPLPPQQSAWAQRRPCRPAPLARAGAEGCALTLTYLVPAGSSEELTGHLCVRGRSL